MPDQRFTNRRLQLKMNLESGQSLGKIVRALLVISFGFNAAVGKWLTAGVIMVSLLGWYGWKGYSAGRSSDETGAEDRSGIP